MFFEKAGKELIGKPVLNLLRSRVPHGMPLEEAIQHGRTDQSTPRELASIVSRKYRLVLSVTTKSFDPESEKPSYQVHRIEAQHGKQPHSSVVGRKPGLALASVDKSSGSGLALSKQASGSSLALSNQGSGSGLNSLGEALVEDAMLGQVNSSEVVSDLTGDPASTDLVTFVVSSEETLMQTPTSVLKPSETRHGEFAASSSVRRALLQESPTHSLAEDVLGTDSRVVPKEIGLALVDPSDSPLAVPGADLTDNKRRRGGSQKNAVDKDPKRKKM